MNLSDARGKVIKIIKEFSNSGTLITDGQNADYLLSINTFLDQAQREIATTQRHIKKRHDISVYPIDPLIGEWETRQFLLEDYTVEADGAKSYYFEVDKTATIYIEEYDGSAWNVLSTINAAPTDGYGSYKGNIADTATKKRLRFSGTYPYRFRNYALFGYIFETDSDVPDYKPYVSFELPSDIYQVETVVLTTEKEIYEHFGDYRLETNGGKKYFVIHYDSKGEFQIFYNAYPTAIDEDTALTYEFELDEDAQDVMLYYAAYLSKVDEDPYMAKEMQNLYNIKMNNLVEESIDRGIETIYNETGW